MLLHNAQQKAALRAESVIQAESAKFAKRKEKLDKAMDNINIAIAKAEDALRLLHETNHTIANAETAKRNYQI